MNSAAWRLVNPDAPTLGDEGRALILANRAASLTTDQPRVDILETLAWAQYRRGLLDEARQTMARAVQTAEPSKQEQCLASQRRLDEAIAPWLDGRAMLELASRAEQMVELESQINERRTWRFLSSDEQWWHDQLAFLVTQMHRLEERLAFIVRSVEAPDAVARWAEAVAAIESDPLYGNMQITPQVGLLPIGTDPSSGLWEFVHLPTGAPPVRDEDGELRLTEETGLVFVLIPGGTFWMGAQKTDPHGRNYDELAQEEEGPVHEVQLSPFFLSKYELAPDPWGRMTDWALEYWADAPLEPARAMSWDDCMAALDSADAWLTLPTEAQWEYACRAGTASPWWTGSDPKSLRGKENVHWSDNKQGLLPIGQLDANSFGLHDMHGSVAEWCLDDARHLYGAEPSLDPLRMTRGSRWKAIRGGTYVQGPEHARSSARAGFDVQGRSGTFGLRPARGIVP